MTNFEKMMKGDIELIKNAVAATTGLKKEKPTPCSRLACDGCGCDFPNCEAQMRGWLDAEYKEPVKLNEKERLFCEMIAEGYISRDKSGNLYWFELKPIKNALGWVSVKGAFINFKLSKIVALLFKDNLHFDFIKWKDEEPWSVKDILEVAEDED